MSEADIESQVAISADMRNAVETGSQDTLKKSREQESRPSFFSRIKRKLGWGKAAQERAEFDQTVLQNLDQILRRVQNQESIQGETVLELLTLSRQFMTRQAKVEAKLDTIANENATLSGELALQIIAMAQKSDVVQANLTAAVATLAAQNQTALGETTLEMVANFRQISQGQQALSAEIRNVGEQNQTLQGETALGMIANFAKIAELQADLKRDIEKSAKQNETQQGETALNMVSYFSQLLQRQIGLSADIQNASKLTQALQGEVALEQIAQASRAAQERTLLMDTQGQILERVAAAEALLARGSLENTETVKVELANLKAELTNLGQQESGALVSALSQVTDRIAATETLLAQGSLENTETVKGELERLKSEFSELVQNYNDAAISEIEKSAQQNEALQGETALNMVSYFSQLLQRQIGLSADIQSASDYNQALQGEATLEQIAQARNSKQERVVLLSFQGQILDRIAVAEALLAQGSLENTEAVKDELATLRSELNTLAQHENTALVSGLNQVTDRVTKAEALLAQGSLDNLEAVKDELGTLKSEFAELVQNYNDTTIREIDLTRSDVGLTRDLIGDLQNGADGQASKLHTSLADLLYAQKQELSAVSQRISVELSKLAVTTEQSLTPTMSLIELLRQENSEQIDAVKNGVAAQFAAQEARLQELAASLTGQSANLSQIVQANRDAASSQVSAVQTSLAELMIAQRQEQVDIAKFYNTELSSEVAAAANAVASAIALVASLKEQNAVQLSALQSGVGTQFAMQDARLEALGAALTAQSSELAQVVSSTRDAASSQVSAVHAELGDTVKASKADILAAVVSSRAAAEGAISAVQQTSALATAITENLRSEMASTINSRANDLTSLLQFNVETTGQAEQRLTGHLNEFRAEIASYRHREEMMLRGLTAVAGNKVGAPLMADVGHAAEVLQPAKFDFQEQRDALKRRAPKNFKTWMTAFQAGADEYARNANDSLSVGAHPAAMAFRMFLNFHARGRLLDIGCGPQAIPTYLDDYPIHQIAAIDPLVGDVEHPFVFARSHAEFLPWPDESFETIVAATSIDHVYLLDVAIAEFARVLPRGGRLLVWTGLFPHTRKYDPYDLKIAPEDEYHLFHPGRNWFEACFEELFEPQEAYDHNEINSFLAYVKR